MFEFDTELGVKTQLLQRLTHGVDASIDITGYLIEYIGIDTYYFIVSLGVLWFSPPKRTMPTL